MQATPHQLWTPDPRAASFSEGENGLATAIQGPPPPRVAHSTPLGLLYLGTHALLRRAAGSVVAPGFVVSPRPSGACFGGVCTRLGGFPVPRRKTHGRVPSPSGLKKYPGSIELHFLFLSLHDKIRYRGVDGKGVNRVPSTGFWLGGAEIQPHTGRGGRRPRAGNGAWIPFTSVLLAMEIGRSPARNQSAARSPPFVRDFPPR